MFCIRCIYLHYTNYARSACAFLMKHARSVTLTHSRYGSVKPVSFAWYIFARTHASLYDFAKMRNDRIDLNHTWIGYQTLTIAWIMTMTVNPHGYFSFLIDCRLQRESLIRIDCMHCMCRFVGVVLDSCVSTWLCAYKYFARKQAKMINSQPMIFGYVSASIGLVLIDGVWAVDKWIEF